MANPEELQSAEERLLTYQAGKQLGWRDSEIQEVNAYAREGKRAEALQMVMAGLNPQVAAQMRGRVRSVSLSAKLAKEGQIPMTAELHQELMEGDAEYQQGYAEQQAKREADYLASMEKAADELQRARGIDPTAAPQPRNWQEAQAMEFRRMEQLERQAMTAAGKR